MKNFYLWLVAAMVCIGILPAAAQDAEVSDITFTVIIPNADGIKCSQYGQDIPLVSGKNVLSFPNGTNISFYAQLPWKITGITDKNGTAVTGFYGTSWYLYVNPEVADQEYTISAINIDEYRTSEFTLNVDDASLVNAVLSGYDQTLSLENGKNTVKYDPAAERFLQITPVNYNVPIYKVTKNGTEVVDLGGSYYNVELEEDCVIDVTAILPDEDHTVSFSYAEGSEGSISVSVNYNEVPDFDGKQLVVKLGDRLEIKGFNNYKYDSVKVNGQEVSFYGSYSFTVMKDSEVYIDAHPYGTGTATIFINLPEYLTITRNGNPLALEAGENLIEFPENEANIMWNVSREAILNSVTVNDTPLSSYTTYYTLNNGDVLVFDLQEKVYDKQFILWIDDIKAPACSSYISIDSQSDRSSFSMGNNNSEWSPRQDFEDGYNLIAFYQALNPFGIGWGYDYSSAAPEYIGQAYVNDQRLVSPYGETSTYFPTDINDGDVIKFFLAAAPVECKVSFDIAEGVEASVVKDVITEVANPAEGFTCFNGTEVVVSGTNLEVKVNGAAVTGEKDEEGNESFTFTVADAATEVAVAAAGGSAVNAIEAASESAVFNLQGVRVGNSLKGLAPGIYIVAGKKVVVKE